MIWNCRRRNCQPRTAEHILATRHRSSHDIGMLRGSSSVRVTRPRTFLLQWKGGGSYITFYYSVKKGYRFTNDIHTGHPFIYSVKKRYNFLIAVERRGAIPLFIIVQRRSAVPLHDIHTGHPFIILDIIAKC